MKLTYLLFLSIFSLTSCTDAINIIRAKVPNYTLEMSGPSSVLAGTCSSAITAELKDETGATAVLEASVSLALSGAQAGSFYSDSSCSSPISALTLNSSSAVLYYKSSGYDATTVTVTAGSSRVDQTSFSFNVTERPLFELDADFAISGTYSNQRSNLDYLNGLEFDNDDKLVLVSVATSGSYSYISRIDPDLGAIDTSFNTVGDLQISYGGSETYMSTPHNETSGKIVTGGAAANAAGRWQINLSRVNNDGSMDTTFGSGGKVDLNICGIWCWAWDSVKVGSYYYVTAYDSTAKEDTLLFRLDDNGAFDAGYGINRYDPSPGAYQLQSGGVILANSTHLFALYATNDSETTNTTNYYICKYQISDGSLASGFGSSGCKFIDGLNTSKYGLASSNLPMMFSSDENSLFLLMKYEDESAIAKVSITDGSLDSGFGTAGIQKLPGYDKLVEVELHSSLGLIVLFQITDGGQATYALKAINESSGQDSTNSRLSDVYIGSVGSDPFVPFNLEIKGDEIYVSGVLYATTPEEIIQKINIFN